MKKGEGVGNKFVIELGFVVATAVDTRLVCVAGLAFFAILVAVVELSVPFFLSEDSGSFDKFHRPGSQE
jgi:hypothetical protein